MKKINLAKTFLVIGKVISIIMIPVCAILIISGIGLTAASSALETELDIIGFTYGIIIMVFGFVLLPFAIASLILESIALKKLKTVSGKQEANKIAVLAMVAGALLTTFPIVSAILLWTSKDKDYIIDVK